MAVSVRIPAPLRKLTAGDSEVSVETGTVAQIIHQLGGQYPEIKERLCDEQGRLHRFINVYLNDEDVRSLNHLDTKASDGDHISIVPAVAGGAVTKKKVYLTFPQKCIKDPVIYWVGQKFKVITNIRSASVTDQIGLVALELEGENEEIRKAITYLESLNVRVEPIEMNVIE